MTKKQIMGSYVMTTLLKLLDEKRKNEGAENCIDEETGKPFISIQTTKVDYIKTTFACYPNTLIRYLNMLEEEGFIKYVKIIGKPNKIIFIK